MNQNHLGRWGEDLAATYLKQNGYTILQQNYRTRYGEIDLIVQDECYLVFVEVKLRKNADFGSGREFVTAAKQKKIKNTAQCWLMEHGSDLQPRFDVIEIYASDGVMTKKPRLNYIVNAF